MAAPSGAEPPRSETVAFPTFLDTDPYPTTSDDRPATSASAATDATSDFGTAEDYASARERQSNIPSLTGPIGESGLPPSRPTSMDTSVASSQRAGSRVTTAPSRRGLAAFAARSGNSLRDSGEVGSDGIGSRPGSSMSQARTHVPSLAAQGFLRPMSSQKLQAQRSIQRPGSPLAEDVGERTSEESVRRHRYSNASVHTLREKPSSRTEDMPPLPTSRGTATTTTDRTLRGGQGPASVVSNNSQAPLHSRQGPANLTLETNGKRKSTSPHAPKSPRSLRASLGLGSRRSTNNADRRPAPGQHAKLHSEPSSPEDEKKPRPRIPSSPVRTRQPRNYEYFAGNMLFFLGGRFVNVRTKPLNILTFLLTVLPCALFFGFSAPWLWHHVSPAIPLVFAYIFFITISSFLHAAFSDPGILPRNLHPHPHNPEEERDPLTVGPPTVEWVMVRTFPAKRAQKADVEAGAGSLPTDTAAIEVPTKYCKSCNIWRPPRAHHCRVCDACVETQDHHCVWLNNCVGRRNYRFFFGYVGFASLLAFLLMAFSLTHVGVFARRHGISFAASLRGRTQERVAFAMFVYSLLALPYPGSLFVYHLFLTARGETTREYLNSHKFQLKDRHRPFTQSTWSRNWAVVLMRPRPPSYMRFRARYVEGDVRFGHMQPKRERLAALKGKYSVGMNGANGKHETKEEKDVEMKDLPPSPPQQQQLPKPDEFSQTRAPQGGAGAGGGIGLNSTPR